MILHLQYLFATQIKMPNKTVPVIEIPQNCLPTKTQSGSLITLASMAISQKLDVVYIDTSGLLRKSMFIPPILDVRVSELATANDWNYQDAFAALCAASVDSLLKSRISMVADSDRVDVPFAARAGQDRYYKSMLASINKGRVCLAEGSTGIGKSRAIVAAAITAALGGKKPVVIAAPTLAILGGSLWNEYEELLKTGLGASCKVRFFPGASEFIDRDRLALYFAEADYLGEPFDVTVKDWLDAGCPSLTNTPLARAMEKSGKPLRFLMSDLRDLATSLDPINFIFQPRAIGNDPIKSMLEAIRMDAAGSDIIFCTHAMLSVAKLGAWEWFPQPNVIFIDEAHLFEGIASSVTSTALSLSSFQHSVRLVLAKTGLGSGSTAGHIDSAMTDLIGAAKALDIGGGGIRFSPRIAADSHFVQGLNKLAVLLKKKAASAIPRADEARECIRMTLAAIAAAPDANSFGRLDFSPDRRFPSILVGNRSVSGMLGAIWRDAVGGVVLASASLSTPDNFGNNKFDYISQLLALPIARLDSPTPIVAPWLTSIPIIHTPSDPSLLARPFTANRTEKSEYQWLSTLAEQLLYVSDQAIGGTLVLMTSYAQIDMLAEILADLGLCKRLVAQRPDEKFQACEMRFRAFHAAGKRPLLIGLGVAWTGVDLTDKTVSAQDDRLVTDLVIGCLPIGLNRSSTMASRVDLQGLYPIIKESIMLLMQGMGRSVRSEHARSRNIWMMDGRLWMDWPGMSSLQRPAWRIIERYANRATFG